jgi:amino acid transporter
MIVPDSAESQLARYGYRQEFDRSLKRFASFAIGFSFISITTGIFTTYGSVLNSSGPLGIWTWPIVIVGQLAVALVFGALASRMPLAGYTYQWMSRLANPHIGWLVGWFMFAFLVVDVVAVDYAVASTVAPALFGYTGTTANTWVVTAVVIVAQGLLIMFSTIWAERVNNTAVATELIGIGGLTVLLLIVGAVTGKLYGAHLFSKGAAASVHPYFSFGSLSHGSPWMLAFLLGAFTIVGFEACGNLAEETDQPERVVPRAMWTSVLLSGVLGFLFLIAISTATWDIPLLTSSGTPVADIVKHVLGSVIGKIFLVLVFFSIFACGLVIYITASRVAWAMSRDERFPGWRTMRRVSTSYRTPLIATVVVGAILEVVLAAFATSTGVLFKLFSAATLMPAIIYLITVILYVLARHKLPAERGFNLGAWEWPVIITALVWLLFELSIFRDASFKDPWIYVAIMLGVGLLYFVYMLATKRSLSMPGSTTEPAPGPTGAEATESAVIAHKQPQHASTTSER